MKCSYCTKKVNNVRKYCTLCRECINLEMPDAKNSYKLCNQHIMAKKVAKCGHLSTNRYFECLSCSPYLPPDDEFESSYRLTWRKSIENNCE